MKNTGIIAEYNPFHKGHAHQIRILKEQGTQNIVTVLSGSFVQRGAPAWTDKYLRTKIALEQGVDFVFELPVLFALSSAEGFATGGISSLNALPLDSFCFGYETGEPADLEKIADFLADEPELYKDALQEYTRKGMSFPAAREQALRDLLPDTGFREPLSSLLAAPNNILAIEYLKAARQTKSRLYPIAVPRQGAGYHDRNVSGTGFSSASAIRHAFQESGSLLSSRQALPQDVFSLLQKEPGRYPMEINDFSQALYFSLRSAAEQKTLSEYGEITEDLAARIQKHLPEYTDADSFLQTLKTKNMTHSRISRCLFQLLLGIPRELYRPFMRRQPGLSVQTVPYLRLLGMNVQKSAFLRKVTALPIITKVADAKEILESFYAASPATDFDRLSFAERCLSLDILASDLYRQALFQKTGYLLPDEYRAGVIRYDDTICLNM